MAKAHVIRDIHFKENKMLIRIDGKPYSFELSEISDRLLHAAQKDRENYRISASGYGIHWPSIDEDLSIDGLIGRTHRPTFKKKQLQGK